MTRQVGLDRLQLLKVPAHEEVDDNTPEVLRWARMNNDIVDSAAKTCNGDRGSDFWERWKLHSHLVTANRYIAAEIRKFQVKVLSQWNVSQTMPVEPAQLAPRPGKVFPMVWRDVSRLDVVPQHTAKILGAEFAHRLLEWWNEAVDWSGQSPLRWIAFAQLFLHFQLTSRHPGLIRQKRSWYNPSEAPLLVVEDYSFRDRNKWFRLCLQQLWKDGSFCIGRASTRPSSRTLVCHLGCASIPAKQGMVDMVEQWLSQRSTPIFGHGAMLDKLPPAW